MTIAFDALQLDVVTRLRTAAPVPADRIYELEDVQTLPEEANAGIVVGVIGAQPLADLVGDVSDWRATLRLRVMVRDNRRPTAGANRPVWDLAAAIHGIVWNRYGIEPRAGEIGCNPPRLSTDSDERDTRIGIVDIAYELYLRANPQTLEYVPS